MNFIYSKNLTLLTKHIYNTAFPKSYSKVSLYEHETVKLSYQSFGKDHEKLGNLIILHGVLGSKKEWSKIGENIAELAKKQVFVVDMRNHGQSPHHDSNTYFDLAADLSVFMPSVGINQASFIGHDMGGRAAMLLALLEPEKVEKLIAVDISPVSVPQPFRDVYPKIVDVMWTVNFDPNETNIDTARDVARNILSTTLVLFRDVDAMSFILNNINFKSNKTIGWTCNLDCIQKNFANLSSFPSHLVNERLFSGPTMFIAGDKSNFMPPDDIAGILEFFPKAQVKYFNDAGHNIHVEKPDEFLETVVKFNETQINE